MVKIFLLAIAVWLVIIVLKRYLKHSENRTPEKTRTGEYGAMRILRRTSAYR